MKKFKKFISCLTAVMMLGSMAVIPYASAEEKVDSVKISAHDEYTLTSSIKDNVKISKTAGEGNEAASTAESVKITTTEQIPADGITLSYEFEVPSDGLYSMNLVANPLAPYIHISRYSVSIDSGEYTTYGMYVPTYTTVLNGVLWDIAWPDTYKLAAGKHTFNFKITYDSGAASGKAHAFFSSATLTKIEEADFETVEIAGGNYSKLPESGLSVSKNGVATNFKGDTLPEDGYVVEYDFEVYYDGVYNMEISNGNLNNEWISQTSVAIDNLSDYVTINASNVKATQKHSSINTMCVYELNKDFYLEKGNHKFYYIISDISLNKVFAYFEYAKLTLNREFSVEDVKTVDENDEEVYALSDADTVRGYAKFKNYTENEKTVSFITALYNDSVLEAVTVDEVSVLSGEVKPVTASKCMEVKGKENAVMYLMVWDDGMKTYSEKYAMSDNGVESMDVLMHPFWEGKRIYNETILPVSETGSIEDAQGALYHTPTNIISVKSADLSVEYEEGVDWIYSDGKIRLLEGSAIPYLTTDELYPETVEDGFYLWDSKETGKYILHTEKTFWHEHQIAVTYDHDGAITENIPQYAGNSSLKKTAEKLKNGEDLYVVLNGDSISVGANSSGFKNVAPFMSTWGELFCDNLRKNYNSNITFNNTAKGGQTSVWGLENADTNIVSLNPDLVIIGFGMNDATIGMKKDTFKANISGIIEKVKAKNPDAEFILVSGICANPEAKNVGVTLDELREGILELGEEYSDCAAVADITSVHKMLLSKKAYVDMTGNNINHINDYLTRWYAQALSALIIE